MDQDGQLGGNRQQMETVSGKAKNVFKERLLGKLRMLEFETGLSV